jgi:hypothetical protein
LKNYCEAQMSKPGYKWMDRNYSKADFNICKTCSEMKVLAMLTYGFLQYNIWM